MFLIRLLLWFRVCQGRGVDGDSLCLAPSGQGRGGQQRFKPKVILSSGGDSLDTLRLQVYLPIILVLFRAALTEQQRLGDL